ncbi:MAG TPA: N-methyl-D-aspartate receptor NMDAR2C subunit [Polyangia bacterium]|jgi:predicted metal-dependent HD superfamily phosphohydrolase|nr:N-methyl-D-aspartate receptor NMDAR2C subunit [Polyangia bacterium]
MTPPTLAQLEDRWLDLWRRLGARGEPRRYHDELVALYSAPDRAYHTLVHIAECLGEAARLPADLAEGPLIELALWYHDAIYDTRAQDSEERSAELAGRVACEVGLSEASAARVDALIRLTKTHEVPEADLGAAYLIDIDLAILGSSPDRFAEYDRQIRQEYGWVPAEFYEPRRRQVLAGFLGRPALYRTPLFRDRYEQRARANLQRLLGLQ